MQLSGVGRCPAAPELLTFGSKGLENCHRRATEPHRHVAVWGVTGVPIRDSTITGTQNIVSRSFRTRPDRRLRARLLEAPAPSAAPQYESRPGQARPYIYATPLRAENVRFCRGQGRVPRACTRLCLRPGWASAPEGNEFLRVRRLTR